MSDATYRHEDIRAVPHGYKVRTMTRGTHRVRVAFPPGRRQVGAGVLVSILHPKRESNPCRLANPLAELVLMGAANPARQRHDSLWHQARKLLKGNRNPNRWDGARRILTGAKRANPDAIEKAADLYEDFHGKEPSEVIEMQEADTVRKTYTALGDLVDLTIETPEGQAACIEFAGDGVKVASAPGGKQLYLIGGAQSLDDQLEKFGADAHKDFVELGRARQITYRARKGINDFRLVDYYHDLGEESGNPPLAFYDRLRQRIYFVGGSYHIEAPGIID